MTSSNPSSSSRRRRVGFTIIELLCVIAIMMILLGLTIPAISSIMQGSNITRAAQLLLDQLSLARQTAVARNRTVELRFIKLASTDNGYGGVQLWMTDSSGSNQPASRLNRMPAETYIAASTALSPLLNYTTNFPYTNTMAIPGWATAPYVAMKIRPAGTVEPVTPPSGRSDIVVTITSGKDALLTVAPQNYATVQVNPDTGNPLLYRP